MKIYELNFDVDHYRSIQLCEEADVDYYQMFDGTSLAKKWKILKVKEYEEDKKLKIGDAPGFNIPVLNRKALDILFPLIKDNVEILPLQFKDELLYGINVLKILDAINYDLSEYMTFRDGKKIMAFDKYVFKEEMVKNNNIFKIKDIRIGLEFVSEEFYNCVIDNKLEGFDMRLVYETNFECASCNKESNTGWEENGKMKFCFSVVRDVEDDIYGDIQRMASEAAAVFRIQYSGSVVKTKI